MPHAYISSSIYIIMITYVHTPHTSHHVAPAEGCHAFNRITNSMSCAPCSPQQTSRAISLFYALVIYIKFCVGFAWNYFYEYLLGHEVLLKIDAIFLVIYIKPPFDASKGSAGWGLALLHIITAVIVCVCNHVYACVTDCVAVSVSVYGYEFVNGYVTVCAYGYMNIPTAKSKSKIVHIHQL